MPHRSTLLQKPYAFSPDESVTTNTNSLAIKFSGLANEEKFEKDKNGAEKKGVHVDGGVATPAHDETLRHGQGSKKDEGGKAEPSKRDHVEQDSLLVSSTIERKKKKKDKPDWQSDTRSP